MEEWRNSTRLSIAIDAMILGEQASEVQDLLAAFGGSPDRVWDRRIGEPGLLSRHMLFPNGGRVVLHDDAVVAVVLPADLSEWVPSATTATLDDLAEIVGTTARFNGLRSPYFIVGGAYLVAGFEGGWNTPGRLRRLVVLASQPGLTCSPLDDDCPACADLPIRGEDDAVDVHATIAVLTEKVSSAVLREDVRRVRLADMEALHAAGVMHRVECQLTCAQCRRIVCFTLVRGGPAVLEYRVYNDAVRHPLEPIPPVELWAGAERISAHDRAMHYLDHEPGSWFLAGRGDEVFLDVRYSPSTLFDTSALIRLDPAEVRAYRADGRPAVEKLVRRIRESLSNRPGSVFRTRDLRRDPTSVSLRDEFSAAIAPHTWRAEQYGSQS